ncbi:MAG: hypothetical protein RLO17_24705 [Cyclobacteriaceae bacterium]|jgi:hypothetical protein|tara:strand:+ start:850 stop:1350 length:501 start_codon:yes stop_codon:yes gene_type:complete
MRRYPHPLLLLCFAISLFTCSDEPVPEGLIVEMVVVDHTGEETTELSGESGEFALALKAINHTNEEIEINSFNACFLAQGNKEFMKIYRKINGSIAVGRPFSDEVVCAAIALPPRPVPANEYVYLAKCNWLDNPENSVLPQGEYFTKTTVKINEKYFETYVKFIIK